ncbi:MAG: OmpA family protein [Bacteroidales bacterium]
MRIIITFFLSTTFLIGYSQNIFFTHTEAGKNFYNPSYCNYNVPSLTVLHRNTFLTNDINLRSITAGFDIPIRYSYKRFNSTYFSVYFFDERMNKGGYIRQMGGLISMTQNIRIAEHALLGLGLQYSRYVKTFSTQDFYTGAQWDPYLGFNPALPNGENLIHQQNKVSSLSAGLFWQKLNNVNDPVAYVGIAAFNLNRPFETFIDNASRSLPRYSIMAGYRVFDNNKILIIPEFTMYSFIYQYYFSMGMKMGMYTSDNNPFLPFYKGNIVIETRYVNRNAMVGFALEQPLYKVGLSYDFPISRGEFKNTSGFELHLTIKLWRSRVQKSEIVSQEYTIGQVRKFFEQKSSESSSSKELKQEKTEEPTTKAVPGKRPISLALKQDFKFGFNDATLNNEACRYLDELVELLKNNERMYIEIIGHTDDVGTREANRIISYRRAQVVADYLISKGISADRIKVVGKLDAEPLFPNTSPENRAKNRRVEFILYQY